MQQLKNGNDDIVNSFRFGLFLNTIAPGFENSANVLNEFHEKSNNKKGKGRLDIFNNNTHTRGD